MKKAIVATLATAALFTGLASPANAVSSYCNGDKKLVNYWDLRVGATSPIEGHVREYTSARCGTAWAEGWRNNGEQIYVGLYLYDGSVSTTSLGTGHQITNEVQIRFGSTTKTFWTRAAKPGVRYYEYN